MALEEEIWDAEEFEELDAFIKAAEATAPAADHAGDAGDNDTALPAPAAALPPNEEQESKQLELESRSDEAKPAADVDADDDSFLRRAPESEPPEFGDEEEKPNEGGACRGRAAPAADRR